MLLLKLPTVINFQVNFQMNAPNGNCPDQSLAQEKVTSLVHQGMCDEIVTNIYLATALSTFWPLDGSHLFLPLHIDHFVLIYLKTGDGAGSSDCGGVVGESEDVIWLVRASGAKWIPC